MKLQTASETISYLRESEESAAQLYEKLAERFPEDADLLNELATNCRKYIKQIQRSYQSVISDAIEGCFAFTLETGDYPLQATVDEDERKAALAKVKELEEAFESVYTVAAKQSESLMADVPRQLKLVARKRRKGIERLSEKITG
jgi:uncharacterized membrane-anchored protein YhcB (DUF1043 family)